MMNALQRLLARLLGSANRAMKPADAPTDTRAPRRVDPMASPWRIYRLYAAPPRLLVRNEQGKVVELGAVSENALSFNYRMHSGPGRGQGFDSLAALLEHAADALRSRQVDAELTALPPAEGTQGDDLNGREFLDVSLRADG